MKGGRGIRRVGRGHGGDGGILDRDLLALRRRPSPPRAFPWQAGLASVFAAVAAALVGATHTPDAPDVPGHVIVLRGDRVEVDGRAVTMDDATLARALLPSTGDDVLLVADEDTPYGTVSAVVDAAMRAGMTSVRMATRAE